MMTAKCQCGESEYSYLLKGKKFSVLSCNTCKLARTHPFPKPDYSEKDVEREIKKDETADSHARKFAIEAINQILSFKKSGRLLDIGAGRGMLVNVASEKGFEAKGIEINKNDSEYARKILKANVTTEDVFKANMDEKYDVIVMNHVLEHIENPIDLLKRAKFLLKEDGIILIGLPNVASAWRVIQGESWYPYQHTQHIWHFSPKTLKHALIKAGFKVKKITITSVEHSIVLEPFNIVFKKMGIGDNLFAVAE